MQRAELLTARARRALREERGTAFLMGLALVMVMTLLGVALFEMSTIEAGLARGDVSDMQAFYCAEAELARVFALYAPASDPSAARGSDTFEESPLVLANGTYRVSASAVVDPGSQLVTVTATCRLPDGRTRTVQRNGVRQFQPFDYSLIAGLGPAAYAFGTSAQGLGGDLVLGGVGAPQNVGGALVGGADAINGDIFVSGNVHLRGEATVTGYGTDDPPAITVAPGKTVTSTSSRFDPTAPGATGQGTLDPAPAVSNPDGTGAIDRIQKAVTDANGQPLMTGTYRGATVYNLAEIFKRLGATNEGNSERNLARPAGCTFGVASADPRCQIWQDLAILGPRQTCNPGCPPGTQGPTDKPRYFFMGLPRSPGVAPQQTGFDVIYAAAVEGSDELRQLGFTPQYSSLGARLDALLGLNPNGEGRVDRFVDLTMGTDPETGKSVARPRPPIFLADGYWLADGAAAGFAYNGRGTIAATKSAIVSDNLLYLGSLSNVNVDAPATGGACPTGTTDRTSCGAADLFGILAKEDVLIGDPNGLVREVSAAIMTGRDVSVFGYTSSGECCKGPSNPLTINGTVLAGRQAFLGRDWADPSPGRENAACTTAQSPCRPVVFMPADTSCGATGCWRFLAVDAGGQAGLDLTLPSFRDGCVTTSSVPLTPPTCAPQTRRVTHFQLTVNYDARLQTTTELIPPGLPSGGHTYTGLAGRWRDCGPHPTCP